MHYPGTYVAGVYNRLRDTVDGREVANESLVNLPNWLPLTVRIGAGPWLGAVRWPCWRTDRCWACVVVSCCGGCASVTPPAT